MPRHREINDHLARKICRDLGPWTVDAYLLFAKRRPDAWPSGDLALAKAAQELWGMPALAIRGELDA